MTFFKRNETENNDDSKNKEGTIITTPKVKKKVRIGFGHKSHREHKKESPEYVEITHDVDQSPISKNEVAHHENTPQHTENIDLFLDEIATKDELNKEDIINIESSTESEWSESKRKVFFQKDMKGKQVYLEDTGEKIGTVFDAVYDRDNNLIGFKIKDNKSDTLLSFPLDQFDEDNNGLIFIPSWYMKGLKTIEKLEFKDRITPELIWLIKDNTVSTEELYSIFVKHDDKIANYIEEAVALRELVNNRLKVLEKERLNLKQALMDLTEKRLIKDIDRRQFSEIVMEHRRKVNVVDINLKKCKEILDRLQHTSFGMLSTSIVSTVDKEERQNIYHTGENTRKNSMESEFNRIDPYKEKYFELKNRYGKLQEGYEELKNAVEKLLNKNEL